METHLEQIRDQQKESWNKFSPGWKKWDDLTMKFLRPAGNEIIRLLKPQDNETILDVAAGTGEPGLTIAKTIPSGKVVITDLADGMLEVAKENASAQGIKNVEFKACDVSELPFEDNNFDAISCRFGYMFFPDMDLAAKEMYRVLKPGGRFATSVWASPQKNFWVMAIMESIRKHMELEPPPPGSPGMFRCADPEMMKKLFVNAGFSDIAITEVRGHFEIESIEAFWTFMNEVAAPVVSAMSSADDMTRAKIKSDVFKIIEEKSPVSPVQLESMAMVIYGTKPAK
jgi:ubiquinone/menaquinone biosynthesis C-methylase UbiE